MIQRIIIVLTYILLFLFPTGLLLRIKIYPTVSFVPQDIIVFFIFLLTLPLFIKHRKEFLENKFITLQLLFIIVGFASLVINIFLFHDIDFFASFLYLIRYLFYVNLAGIGIFFIRSRFIGKGLYIAGIILLVIGYLQFFFYNNLRNLFYLGWDEHLYRLFATFLDPNYAGVFFVLFFFLLLIRIIKLEFRHVYFEIIIAFFSLVAVYLTFSRTALVVLFVGLLTLGLVKRKYKMIFSVFFVLLFFLFLFSDTSIEGLNPFRTQSSHERITSTVQVSNVIIKDPFLGVGFNAFRYAQIRYGTRQAVGAATSNADAGTDNSFLFVLATTGIVGFALYIASYFFLVRNLFDEKDIASLVLASSMIGLFAGSFFLNILFYTPILSWVLITIAARKKLCTKDYR
jgi:O-antigen ligase